MKLPLATDLKSRDGALDQDAKVLNGIVELSGEESEVRSRPGFSAFSLVKTGVAQLLISWNGIKSVIGDFFCSGYSPSGSYTNSTTWNSADKSANVTLSGGDLTTAWSSAANGSVRSAISVSSGLWYWEVTINTLGSPLIGVANSLQALDLTGPNYRVSYNPVAGTIYGTSATPTFVATSTGGDVIGILYDAANTTVVFYKNGVPLGSLSGSEVPTGAIFAYVASFGSAATNLTTNFAGAFTYTPVTSSTALVVTTGSLPFSGAFNGQNAAAPYLMVNNAEFAWTITGAGAVTKVTDVDYPGNQTPARRTVPGIVYLDTYFFTMDTKGVIYNSAADDPTSWSALGYITAQFENGAGAALAKSQEYVAAFKEFSVELFYDAANPVASPLSPVPNGFHKIGCASGTSLADIKGQIFWVSQSKQAGRSVHVMTGTNVAEVATPDVQRILNADDLATVHAYGVRADGHDLYLLTLVTSNVTLAYDLNTKSWSTWSSLTISASKSITSIVRSGSTVTVTFGSAHGMSDGDPLKISGATPSAYNGIWQVSYVSSTVVTFEITGTPTATATGTLLGYTYTESYFKYTKYTNYQGLDLFLHESDGYLYEMDSALFQDNALPINMFCRTPRLDFGGLGKKKIPHVGVAADKVASSIMIRHSDDDCTTFSDYRIVDMSVQEPKIRRSKSFRRRTYEARHVGNYPIRIKYLDVEAQK